MVFNRAYFHASNKLYTPDISGHAEQDQASKGCDIHIPHFNVLFLMSFGANFNWNLS